MEPKKVVCEVCGELIDEDKYKRHISHGHKEKKEFRCGLCDKEFTSSYNLQYHIAHHLNERNFVCTMCPKAYNTVGDLNQHYKIHEKQGDQFKCDFCDLFFVIRNDYKIHLKSHTVDNKGPKECQYCGKLVKDMKQHHETVHLNIRNHECDKCHKRFHRRSRLDNHIAMVHDKLKNCICDVCGKAFSAPTLLRKHKLRHKSGLTTFHCGICKIRTEDVKTHFETVHKDLPFSCDHCHRRFKKLRECNKHIKSMHTTVRDWICDLCGKRFAEEYQLKRHFTTHVGDNGLTLEEAEKLKTRYIGDDKEFKRDENSDDDGGIEFNDDESSESDYNLDDTDILGTETDVKPSLVETYIEEVNVDITEIKEEPDSPHDTMCYQFSPSQISVKSEKLSDDESDNVQLNQHQIDKYVKQEDESDDESDNEPLIKKKTKLTEKLKTKVKEKKRVKDLDEREKKKRKVKKKKDKGGKCTMCDAEFDAKEDYRKHFMSEHIEYHKPTFSCQQCKTIFTKKGSVYSHVNQMHVKLDCEFCDEEFTSKYAYDKHLQVDHGTVDESSLTCEHCGKVFMNKGTLKLHIEAIHTGSGFPCSICGKKYSHKSAMYDHINRQHKDDRKHKCEKCPKQYVSKHELKRHVINHHKPKDEIKYTDSMCFECGISFPSEYSVMKHKRLVHCTVDKEYYARECYICKEDIKNIYMRRKHIAQVHLNGTKLKRVCGYCKAEFDLFVDYKAHIETHTEVFICITCGEFFYDKETLKSHEYTHRAIDVHLRKFICDYCNHRTFTRYQLENHMVNHVKSPNLFYCDVCGKGFKIASSLYTHRLYHDEGEFVCSYCGKKFARNNELVSHVRIHTNEKPFKCEVCGKAFMFNHLLRSHKQVHPETRIMVKCKKCQEQFIDNKQLAFHETQFHPEMRPYQCFICNVAFRLEHNLRSHNRSKHLKDLQIG